MKLVRVLAPAAAVAVAAALFGIGSVGARSWEQTLVASPTGSGSACTFGEPCALPTAVQSAGPGATVLAESGTYDVSGLTITQRLNLQGLGHAVLDASSSNTADSTNCAGISSPIYLRGVLICGPGAAGTSVRGLTVEDAFEEGILAVTTSDLNIAGNTLIDNDQGFAGQAVDECSGSPEEPGDCGEALHLLSVTDSRVVGNYVSDNAGGILLTDELGPTAHNQILSNRSIGNSEDCGITLAGHNGGAVSPVTGLPIPAAGGVYDNLVSGNISEDNGVAGQGAGILLGGGAPYSGVYDNTVSDNQVYGNGLSGITVHQHFAGDLNGNRIVSNWIGRNNVDGDYDFSPTDPATTGILVASGPVAVGPPPPGPLTGTEILFNHISQDAYGIWTLNANSQVFGNSFFQVTTQVLQQP
ncbi:MAG: right-handed parallel beta-helix repeat-containing protein [Candidatus Dormibacteria bacterium]